jgi:hypothetical protein
MNSCPIEGECARFPMRDYDALERELNSMRERLTVLEPRYAAMTEELDRITEPGSRLQSEFPKIRGQGFEFRGQFFAERTCIGIYFALMQRLWTEFSEHRNAMAKAAGRNGRSRSYIAQTPEELFRDQPSEWSRRHSQLLVNGWFIDTNMNPKQMQTILKLVLAAVGLVWGKHVKVVWRGISWESTQMR